LEITVFADTKLSRQDLNFYSRQQTRLSVGEILLLSDCLDCALEQRRAFGNHAIQYRSYCSAWSSASTARNLCFI